MGIVNSILLGLLLLVVLAACTGRPKVTSANGFSVGETYIVDTPIPVIERGKRSILVPEPEQGKSSSAAEYLEPGTVLEVVAIRADNTWTRRTDHWPEAVVRKGAFEGRRVSLQHPRLSEYLRVTRR